MKRPGIFSNFAESKAAAIKYAMSGFACAIVGYGLWFVGVPVWQEFKTSFAYRDFQKYGVIGTYQHRFFGVFGKMKEMESLDRENHELNQRVAMLEREVELERVRNAQAEMKEITEELSDRIKDEAGSELARVLPAIGYNVPTHLLPHQLFALALGYFRKQEYEQSAVLFHHLLGLQDDTSYQRADVQLLSAISWYHLKNYKLAKHYLRIAVKGANPSTALYRTAVLWEAILAKAEGHKAEAQHRLTAALAQFPHSDEASWINTRSGAGRKVASRELREPNQAVARHLEAKKQEEQPEANAKHGATDLPSEKKSTHEEVKHE